MSGLKRIVAFVLALCMVFGLCATAAWAQTTDVAAAKGASEGDFTIENGVIVAYTGAGGDLVIPDSIGGQPVIGIGAMAFYGVTTLTSVSIPDAVTYISDSAFASCTALTSVRLPAGLVDIEDYAFSACEALQTLVLPDTLESIGAWAFAQCGALTGVQMGDKVEYIGQAAFLGCAQLQALALSEGLTEIEREAFFDCAALQSIAIPAAVATIGTRAFVGCDSLMTIDVAQGNVNYSSDEGLLYAADGTLVACPGGRTGAIWLTQAAKVGASAFEECAGVTEVWLPGSFTAIQKWAFRNCSSLTKVAILPEVTSISDTAFEGCNLTALTICGMADTEAQRFATAKGIAFQRIFGVYFVDWDGSELESQLVLEGEDAQAPPDPQREGYEFIGWDQAFTNVTTDLVVTALYRPLPVDKVATPVLQPVGGEYVGSLTVTATCDTPDAVLRYTLDGQQPTADSPLYEGSIVIPKEKRTNTLTIQIKGFKEGMEDSEVAAAQYVIYQRGDVDGNGTVTSYDALLALRISTGGYQPTEMELKRADLDGTGVITSFVALRILRYSAGGIQDL